MFLKGSYSNATLMTFLFVHVSTLRVNLEDPQKIKSLTHLPLSMSRICHSHQEIAKLHNTFVYM